jgi:hypothetical protein
MTPTLNLPSLKKKGLTVMSHLGGGIRAPFYVPNEVFPEGTVLKLDPAAGRKVIDEKYVGVLIAGTGDGPKAIGFAMQETYDDTLLGQLQGYRFANDTRQRLGTNEPIGVVVGSGYCETRNYVGVVAAGQKCYVAVGGKLSAAVVAGNELPAVFETAGDATAGDPKPVRVRFDFPLSTVAS